MIEKCKPCEIYKRISDLYKESCFSQKIFTNVLNKGLPLKVEKTIHEVDCLFNFFRRPSNKKEVPNWAISKEDPADSLLRQEKPITIDFLEKSATVNSWQLLRQYSPYSLNDPPIYRHRQMNIYIYIYVHMNIYI